MENNLNTAPRPFVFVLMPFDASFNDVYALGIRPACEAAGAYCERVDEQVFQESILQRIYNQISKADVVVADMTGRNANVFYETGYAHALGKHVILLTQDGGDIPFDLKHYPHIIYGGSIASMKQDLERRVRWCVERPNQSAQSLTDSLEIYVNGTKVEGGERIDIKANKITSAVPFALNVMLHNAGDRTYKGVGGTDFGLFLPQEFLVYDIRGNYVDTDEEAYSLPLPDGRALHSFGPLENLLPDKWEGVRLMITSGPDTPLAVEKEYPATARIYTDGGPRDVEFFIILHSEEPVDEAQPSGNRGKQGASVSQVARSTYTNVEKGESARISRLAGSVERNLELMRSAFDFMKTLSDEAQTWLDTGISVVRSYMDMPYALRAYFACEGKEELLKNLVQDLREKEDQRLSKPVSVYRTYSSPLIDFHPEADRVFTEVDAQLGVICKNLGLKFPGGSSGRLGGKRELTSGQWTSTDLTRAFNILNAAKSVLE